MKKRKIEIKEKQHQNLFVKLMEVANLYKNLIDAQFFIVDENYDYIEIRFRKKDFVHLTGLHLDVNDNSFYSMYNKNVFRKENILKEQEYNYRNLMKKMRNLYEACLAFVIPTNNLFLKKIDTNTRTYPYGIAGHQFVLCLDGKKYFHPKSIRDDKINTNYEDVLSIYAIYSKSNKDKFYNDLIYIHKNAKQKEIELLLDKVNL